MRASAEKALRRADASETASASFCAVRNEMAPCARAICSMADASS